jgi:hypothetical protein
MPGARRAFVPAPPFPAVYGPSAVLALGLGLFGGFAVGLYALGGPAFGWPAGRYVALVQAHGQVQTLGLAGLLILGVGALLLPGFWRSKISRPRVVGYGGGLVGAGLIAQLIGQPLDPGVVRSSLLVLGAILPPLGFAWAGSELLRPRLGRPGWPAVWESMLLLAACSLVVSLVLRALLLLDLASTGLPAAFGVQHQALISLELDGFLLAATVGVQLRLLPSLARLRPVTGLVEWGGLAGLALAVVARLAGFGTEQPWLVDVGNWLAAAAVLALLCATGLWRPGLAPTVRAPATLLPGRTRWVLRAAWAGLIAGALGRATGLLSADAATHAFTSVYLVPLILVVGIRMLPRVSAYPIRFPSLCGALIWAGVAGGALRAFGGLLGVPAGWQIAWLGGGIVTCVVLVFALLAWSPWGVPTGVLREPETARR